MNRTKIVYLILAHNTPSHLKRLVSALLCPESSFFIHVDKKADISEFNQIKGENIFFSDKRIPIYWGEYSQVEAIINLMRQALRMNQDYDYFVLLSGSDYPLRSKGYINSFFEIYKGTEFINIVNMPCEEAGKSISRLEEYRVRSDLPTQPMQKIAQRLLRKIGLDLQCKRNYRKYLGNVDPYAGSAWWALTNSACRYVLHFIDKEKSIVKYFENTSCPDEMLFQTIIGNSPFKKMVKRNLTYTDWSAGKSSPSLITQQHISFFEKEIEVMLEDAYGQGEALFARKFPDKSDELVKMINEMVKRKDESLLASH